MTHEQIRADERERLARIFDGQASNSQAWAEGHGGDSVPDDFRKRCAVDAVRMRLVAATIRAQTKEGT